MSDSISNRSTSPISIDSVPNTTRVQQEPLPYEIATRSCKDLPSTVRVAVWSSDYRKAFDTWWAKTSWRQENQAIKIEWDRAKKMSSLWKTWETVAWVRDGKPAVQCDRCTKVLKHPMIKNIGTSHMNKHCKSSACLMKAEVDGKGPLTPFLSSRLNVSV